eukprot:625907-Hanusia_phi.AAC.1
MSSLACFELSLEDAIAGLYPEDIHSSPVLADPLDLMHSWVAALSPAPTSSCKRELSEMDLGSSQRWMESTLERSDSIASLSSTSTAALSDMEGGETASRQEEKKGKAKRGYKPKTSRTQWTKEEHERFLAAVEAHCPREGRSGADGKVFVGLGAGVAELIASEVKTRTVAQIRSHAQKYFLRESRRE